MLEVVRDVNGSTAISARANCQGVPVRRLVPVIRHRGPEDLDVVCHQLLAIVAVLMAVAVNLNTMEPEDEAPRSGAVVPDTVMPVLHGERPKDLIMFVLDQHKRVVTLFQQLIESVKAGAVAFDGEEKALLSHPHECWQVHRDQVHAGGVEDA